MFAHAMRSPRHPILAHIVPTRRCNLSCAYCNEFDDSSQPVETTEMFRRIDRLAELGTTVITLSGGEPLLHPNLDEIIKRIRQHGILATLITNGYLLTPERIRRLNSAGLDQIEISVDNLVPNDVSKKSLKLLDRKLQWLAALAEFDVNINTVLGAGVQNPDDALVIAQKARELGFTSTVGIVHDHSGQLVLLSQHQQGIFERFVKAKKRSFARYNLFQRNLVRGLPNAWHCHAGSRYLYVCEDGLVHYCSQQRGHPGIPLDQYTQEDLNREYETIKPCAPFCTINCVHLVGMLDDLREKPFEMLPQFLSATHRAVRVLGWLFLKPTTRGLFKKTALWVLGVK